MMSNDYVVNRKHDCDWRIELSTEKESRARNEGG